MSTRRLAVKALGDVLAEGAKPKEALERLSGGLDARDRAFLMELTYGVVRHKLTLDMLMSGFLKNPSGLPGRTLDNLRAACYQIFFMRTPEFAAVNEAVDIEKDKGTGRSGKPALVNAVLRSILRDRGRLSGRLKDMEAELLKEDGGEKLSDNKKISYMSALTSHPEWLVRRWTERFGTEEALELLKANNLVPPLTLRVNTLRTDPGVVIRELKEMGIEAKAGKYSPSAVRLKGTVPFSVFAEALAGKITVQDEAAQLVSLLLAPRPGERVLDACAAPGGKSTHMAELMGGEGAVVAVDIDANRMPLLTENAARLGLGSIEERTADVLELDPEERFDRIMLDAPCSALGVIRRNPDVKYRHSEAVLKDFGTRQSALLASVSGLLMPGGVLMYCTCSTEPEEGEEVVRGFLRSSPDFYIIETVPPPFAPFVRDGFLRTYPHRDDMDGFFGAMICKKQ